MEKQKRWQLSLIIIVMLLTLYNILPTIFYYSRPLHEPINQKAATKVAEQIVIRVDSLEEESKEWLASFSKLIGVKPESIQLDLKYPRTIQVRFEKENDAETFKRFLPAAGAMIPFPPAQLKLSSAADHSDPKTVFVQRNIPVHLQPEEIPELFQFDSLFSKDQQISPLYQNLVNDRVIQVALGFAGPSVPASMISAILDHSNESQFDNLTVNLAKEIIDFQKTFGSNSPITKRYFASFSQIDRKDREELVNRFAAHLETLQNRFDEQIKSLKAEELAIKEEDALLHVSKTQEMELLESQSLALETAATIIKKNSASFKAGPKPLSAAEITAALEKSFQQVSAKNPIQELDLNGYNPFINRLSIDWTDQYVQVGLYDDLIAIRENEGITESVSLTKEKLNQLIINDIARVSRKSDETISPSENGYRITLNHLNDTKSFLALNMGSLAKKYMKQLDHMLSASWTPRHQDLVREVYPIREQETYVKERPEEQKLGLVLYAPVVASSNLPYGFRNNSIYVIAKGLGDILEKYQGAQDDDDAKTLMKDFTDLQHIMQQNGFIGYAAASYGMGPEYAKDYIFELSDYYNEFLMATREDFYVKGNKKYAVLEFTDFEQRLLTLNHIEDRIQEDLLKWKEAYGAAQVSLNIPDRYTVPKPTENVYLQNFKLSFIKYFRGDDRKVLKWGLDLSGGKTVRIGLRDQNNRAVTDPDALKQAVNELYNRINSMGVSERTIRIEGETILLDFPGSQAFSAAELIKASAMYFHIVNEKFTLRNREIGEEVNKFMQDVWNEAVVTNRKDANSINEIAWQHMGGDLISDAVAEDVLPRSESAKILYAHGLRLANPRTASSGSAFNDTLSSVAVLQGNDASEWKQPYPLIFVFHNYALEGSSLDNVNVGYTPSEGNVLTFGVKRSSSSKGASNPRDDFYSWTSQFAEDKITGTPKEAYSDGHGWRMAVILNGKVITSPVLRAPLRDTASITGHFSQREINQLAADLKAGSLSYTPYILSEQNVSPELGHEERTKGIAGAAIGVALVVLAMIGYYHFAGVVAACAVLLNLPIMWGVLQSIGAAITLPGIAGMVLTIGMAVDANVLVFERFREEFAISGRLASAIQAGYRKAFSAIFDSNITTLMAAFILTQFDSGPIKGFAIVLIIGIVSSMFTALFMTRYFFAGWVRNPKNKKLTMSRFIGETKFDFLGKTKKAVMISIAIMLAGSYFLISSHNTILGMDFTGGYSLTAEMQEKPGVDYRAAAIKALQNAGASTGEVQVRELSRPNQLRIQLGTSMEEKGHPFYQMPQELAEGKYTFSYEKNPRITWVVNALAAEGLHIQSSQLADLENHWTAMSGQLSDTMRNQAFFALALALIGILIYITVRFEFKYAVGAVVGLAHDVLITLGIAALFHKLGFPVQIDLQVIGAIMTIIGYSLNDTIIVFDRIREEVKVLRKWKFEDIINHALNVTLSRTIMTSGTTMLVLLSLVLFGGPSIFGFSLVMTVGVIVGTLSSLFIASPVMLYIHNREKEHQKLAET